MASPEKSAVPVAHGFPNPFYQRIAQLVSRQAEVKDLARAVQEIGLLHKTKTGFDIRAVYADLEATTVKERLRQLWDTVKTGEQTLPVLGSPPRPNQVYGRFGKKTKLVDVGSGNCSKLRKFSGSLIINVVDPALPKSEHVFSGMHRMMFSEFPKEHLRGNFITSFMSLPQLPNEDVQYIQQRDGLHLVPDHVLLLASEVATACDGKIMVRTAKKTYSDNFISMPGYSPAVGYKLCPTYERTLVTVTLAPQRERGDACTIDASPCSLDDINYLDATWKVDGIPLELELNDGVVFATRRDGMVQAGVTDFAGHMCLHLEDFGEGYSLIRVLAYKGMVPPHNGECLRLFAESVEVAIDGKRIQGPIAWEPGAAPPIRSDGIITRIDERDFYCKPGWTVDIKGDDIAAVKKKLSEDGLTVIFDQQKRGLSEYLMWQEGCRVHFQYQKERPDKNSGTSLDTVVFMLSRKNLSELESLTGTPWRTGV